MKLQQLFLELLNVSLLGTLMWLIILIIRQFFTQQLFQVMKYSLWGSCLINITFN